MDYEDRKVLFLSGEFPVPYHKVPKWKPDKSSSFSLNPKYGQLQACEAFLQHQLQPYIPEHQKTLLRDFVPQDCRFHQVVPAE